MCSCMKQTYTQYKPAVGDLVMGKMRNLKGKEKADTVISFTDISIIITYHESGKVAGSEETSVEKEFLTKKT